MPAAAPVAFRHQHLMALGQGRHAGCVMRVLVCVGLLCHACAVPLQAALLVQAGPAIAVAAAPVGARGGSPVRPPLLVLVPHDSQSVAAAALSTADDRHVASVCKGVTAKHVAVGVGVRGAGPPPLTLRPCPA